MLDSVESSSIVPVAASRAPLGARAFSAARGLAALRSMPFSLSVLAHAGLAFVAAQSFHTPAAVSREASALEVAAPELAVETEIVQASPLERALEPSASDAMPEPALAHVATRSSSLPKNAAVVAAITSAAASPSSGVESAPLPVAPPRFALTVAATSAPSTTFATTALASSRSPNGTGSATVGEGPLGEAAVDSGAKLLAGAPPAYTRAAQAAGIEADVPLEIVVDRAGSVQNARVLAHVGYGLDEAALGAVHGYRFAPAHRAGSAVAVRMRWLMRFQLR